MVADEETPPDGEEWERGEGGERTDDEWFPGEDHGKSAWFAERHEDLLESEESERDGRWAAADAVVAGQVPLLPARFDAETDGELLRWVAQCVVAAGLDLHLAGEPRRAARGGVVLFPMTPHAGIGIIWTPHEALWRDPTRRSASERTVRRMTHGVADALDRMGFVVEEFGDQCAHRVIAYDQPDGPRRHRPRPRSDLAPAFLDEAGQASPTRSVTEGARLDQVQAALADEVAAALPRAVRELPEDHRVRLATTDTVRVLLEIGVGIANDQCPAAVRGGAVIEAEVEEIDTVEVWWHTHGALSIARSQFRQDGLRIVWSWVQAAVSRALWDVLSAHHCEVSSLSDEPDWTQEVSFWVRRKRPPQPGRPARPKRRTATTASAAGAEAHRRRGPR